MQNFEDQYRGSVGDPPVAASWLSEPGGGVAVMTEKTDFFSENISYDGPYYLDFAVNNSDEQQKATAPLIEASSALAVSGKKRPNLTIETSPSLQKPHEKLAPLETVGSANEIPLSGTTLSPSTPSPFFGATTPIAAKTKRDRVKNHTPRPSNSFILYRREKHVEIMAEYKGDKTLNNNVISKIVANMWRSERPEVKEHFAAMADAEKRAHMIKYPDYKYRPRKAASPKKLAQANLQKKPQLSYGVVGSPSITMQSSPRQQNSIIAMNPYASPMGRYQMIPNRVQWGSFQHPSLTGGSSNYVENTLQYLQPHNNQNPMSLMEPAAIERGFELMSNNSFGLSQNPQPFEAFPHQDSLLNDFAFSWNVDQRRND